VQSAQDLGGRRVALDRAATVPWPAFVALPGGLWYTSRSVRPGPAGSNPDLRPRRRRACWRNAPAADNPGTRRSGGPPRQRRPGALGSLTTEKHVWRGSESRGSAGQRADRSPQSPCPPDTRHLTPDTSRPHPRASPKTATPRQMRAVWGLFGAWRWSQSRCQGRTGGCQVGQRMLGGLPRWQRAASGAAQASCKVGANVLECPGSQLDASYRASGPFSSPARCAITTNVNSFVRIKRKTLAITKLFPSDTAFL
jgi:hypothetical protein